jgi:hypothetical protein
MSLAVRNPSLQTAEPNDTLSMQCSRYPASRILILKKLLTFNKVFKDFTDVKLLERRTLVFL